MTPIWVLIKTDDDDSVIFDFQALLVAEDGIPPQMFFFHGRPDRKSYINHLSVVRCRSFSGPFSGTAYLGGDVSFTLPETNIAHENPYLSW